jgi:hypothetical protein
MWFNPATLYCVSSQSDICNCSYDSSNLVVAGWPTLVDTGGLARNLLSGSTALSSSEYTLRGKHRLADKHESLFF